MENLLNLLTDNEKKLTKIKHFKKNKIIFREDEKCEEIGIVNYGEVEISSYLMTGEKIIYNDLKKNEIFGINLIFSTNPIYKGDIKCLEDSEISFISKENLLKILRENEKFLLCFLQIESDFTKLLNYKIKLTSIKSAEDRVLFCVENAKNRLKIKSITNLSESIGLTRESTSRAISKLKKEGKLSFSNKTLVLK